MRKKNSEDFASRLDVAGLRDEEIAALIRAARPEEIRAVIAAMSPVDQMRMAINGDPERLALLRAAGIKFKLDAAATVICAKRTKHGPRPEWGQREYVQAAIANLYPIAIPPNLNHSKLWRDVVDWLSNNPDYCAAPRSPLSRPTVIRALRDLRQRNRS